MQVILLQLLALVIALVVHEYMHGLFAYMQGDDTARRAGRLTLNPIPHLDPIGSVILPLVCLVGGAPIFGWAKPVPYNPYNLRDQKWGPTKVALAGPIANFGGAIIFLGMLRLLYPTLGPSNLLSIFLVQLAIVNIVLGVFNLIPVPPLDGSKLLAALLDAPKYRHILLWLETKGPNLLFAIILLDWLLPISLLGWLFGGAVDTGFRLFGLA